VLPNIDTNAFIDWVRAVCAEEDAGYQLMLGAQFGAEERAEASLRGPLRSRVRCWRGGGALTIWMRPSSLDHGEEPIVWRFEVDEGALRSPSWSPPLATEQIVLGKTLDQVDEVVAALLRRVARELGLVADRWPREPMRRLAWQAHRLYRHLHVAEIGRAARAFGPRVDADPAIAWWIFGEARADASGRLLQLVEVCPALLSLLRWLELQGQRQQAVEVLGAAVRGRRLPALVRRAVACWAAVVGLDGEGRRRRAQVTLLRRLAFIPALGAWQRPLPEGVNVDDLPTTLWRQRRWLTVLRHRGLRACELNKLSDPQRRGVGAFFSRHAVRLHALAQRLYADGRGRTASDDLILANLLRRLLPYVEQAGRVPGAQSNPDRWVRDSSRWHERMQWGETALPVGAELPRLARTHWCEPRLEIRQLVTRDEIVEEGVRMRHCVAAMADQALESPIYYFHVVCEGAELTLSVVRLAGDRGYDLAELRGPHNRPATAAQQRAVESWVARLRDDLRDDLRQTGAAPRGREVPSARSGREERW
jgi:hypothetical protein